MNDEDLEKESDYKQRVADANKALDDYAEFMAKLIEQSQSVLFKDKD